MQVTPSNKQNFKSSQQSEISGMYCGGGYIHTCVCVCVCVFQWCVCVCVGEYMCACVCVGGGGGMIG